MSMSSHRQQQQSRVEVWNAIRPDPNYIPGLGRGAQGFTTRSDIGPSKFTPTPAQQAAAKQEQDEAAAQQEFDHFMGADAGAFAYGDYDEDDKEADEIYASVEDIMDKRRKVHREKRERQEYEEFRKENPLIKEMFSDLKRDLANVSEDEWRGIPEIGDYTIKRRKRFENYSANSDSMLAGALATATGNTGNQEQPGAATPGTMTDLTALGQGKKQMLGVNLDRMADSVSGQTTVDPTGYLTSLNSKTVTSAAEVQDIKRARSLMKSMVTSNPGNARGWIAYARLEEVTGNLKTARTLISQGIDACPKNEDVWLEAARLQTQENARALLARGVQSLPTSVKLWMQAARAEPDDAAKRRVLRKALERNSSSVRLWKAAVELHEEEEALVLLSRAVECCPDQVDLWIALVRLEPDFERAKKALNRAVKAIPTEPILYITAAKLQEAHGDVSMVRKIISKAISRKLPDAGVIIDRETWLKEAETAEKASPPMTETCRAIVSAVVDVAVDERERKDTYHRDADEAARRGSIHTARAILEHACEVFPDSERSWRAAAELEKSNGNQQELHAILTRAVVACPNSVILWLMNAKEHWLANDVPTARAALEAAHNHNPDSEEIVLAAFKLEFENGEAERARVIAIRAKDSLADASARVWMKAAVASRELGKEQEEKQLLEEGVEKFGDAPKLHMMLAQWFDVRGDLPGARRALQAGLKHSPRSVPLWLMLARLEERQNNVPAARALLEQARLRVPKSPDLWRAAVRTELRCGNTSAAEVTLNRALQDCDGITEGEGVGSLWAMYIHMAPRAQRKARMADAVRKTDDDAAVFAAFGRVFMADRKYDKARKYFQRAVTLLPDIGDFWGMWVACETADEKPATATQIVEQAQKADPHHGERWCQIRKKPSNAHKPFEDLMKLLVIDLEQRPDKDL